MYIFRLFLHVKTFVTSLYYLSYPFVFVRADTGNSPSFLSNKEDTGIENYFHDTEYSPDTVMYYVNFMNFKEISVNFRFQEQFEFKEI